MPDFMFRLIKLIWRVTHTNESPEYPEAIEHISIWAAGLLVKTLGMDSALNDCPEYAEFGRCPGGCPEFSFMRYPGTETRFSAVGRVAAIEKNLLIYIRNSNS